MISNYPLPGGLNGRKDYIMGKKILSEKQIKWAAEKYCEGYTQAEIAEALFVSLGTIQKNLYGMKIKKPKLVYNFKEDEGK